MNILPEIAPYTFDLPEGRVAQSPPPERGQSRLMILESGAVVPFSELPGFLPPKALLVFNEVRVTPARLLGRTINGGRAEAFILSPPEPSAAPGACDLWCLARPGRKLKPGAEIFFSREEVADELRAEVLDVDAEGRRLIRFHFTAAPHTVLERLGRVPLPAYIKRPDTESDRERYQTVYGKTPGAVAAPTAGLHFTKGLLARLDALGFEKAFVTLKVSAGTFAPLTAEQLREGRLHEEHIDVPEETAEAVRRAGREGRKVIAVGTTTVRSLEWASRGGEIKAEEGWGNIFIRPPYQFKAVDGLVTNFHLPGSSLLMLVSALAGREKILAAYQAAIAAEMNFYSYGDAMLIFRG